MLVIARRDFLAIVATPTFLLFLLAPLFMVGMGLAGGMGASQLADSARGTGRIVAVVDAADVEALRAADRRLRDAFTRGDAPPPLEYRIAGQGAPDPLAITREKGTDTYAVMTGPLASPRIVEQCRRRFGALSHPAGQSGAARPRRWRNRPCKTAL